MAQGFEIQGLKEFRAKVAALPKVLKEEVGGECYDAALLWEQLAKNDAPVDQGRLRNEIKAVQTGELTAETVVNVDYAAYLEWGTKKKVSVPPEVADYAAQFRGGGNSGKGDAKKFIYAWMVRVGIPVEFQYPVFLSIIVNGISPHPFFFIQRPAVEKQFIDRVTKILNTEH